MADNSYIIKAIREHVAINYKKEVDVFDDMAGLLFFTVKETGMTDSFKMVMSYPRISYTVEVTDSKDDSAIGFEFQDHAQMIHCYMAIFTFHKERVQSRFKDI